MATAHINGEKGKNHKNPPGSLKSGYFLAQTAMSVGRNAVFRHIDPYYVPYLTLEGNRRYFEQVAGKVDGFDYCNYWYEPSDAELARKIAETANEYGIDMWTGIRYQKQFRDMPVVPAEYVAWTMDASGRIIPALFEQRNHLFDHLNPEAVDWFLNVLDERYWPYMKGAVNGWFFPETRIPTEVPYSREGHKPWTLHAYSDYVLARWREYCAGHDVRHEGAQVDRFPVPYAHMTEPHPDKTIYIPDNRPLKAGPFTRFSSIPRGTDVWLAWEDFLCGLFHESYVHRISERVNRMHSGESCWKGVCYFNNDATMLDYRNFRTDIARTTNDKGYWPQGRRMGVDVRRLFKDREITCFISETVQSVRDYIGYDENFLSHGMDLAKEYGREDDYGFMLHYANLWGAFDGYFRKGEAVMDDIEENMRWEMFYKYRPPVFSFFPVEHMLVKDGTCYNKEAADLFWKRVVEYKQSFR